VAFLAAEQSNHHSPNTPANCSAGVFLSAHRGLELTTQPALDFANAHGEELWPGARIVFQGIPTQALEKAALSAHAIGVVTREDIGGTLDLAWRLQPQARRIVVVAGVDEIDQRWRSRASISLWSARL